MASAASASASASGPSKDPRDSALLRFLSEADASKGKGKKAAPEAAKARLVG